ncbi:MAG: TIGR04211 family SH3 domain-containing protein [Pseudomonadota bacterium]
MKTVLKPILFAISLLAASANVYAQSSEERQYVTDIFEITMRRGPSTQNAIVRMLESGTPVEVLEQDAESGYSRVRLATSQTEGYVLTRYLMPNPAARSQISALQGRVDALRNESGDQGRELDDLRTSYASAQQRLRSLEQDNERLTSELADLQQKASNVLAIDRENMTLRTDLQETEIELQGLQQSNADLRSQRALYGFVVGAGVLLLGIVLGLILPGLKRRRVCGYGSGDLL